jgi:hypothetical protein
MFLVKGKPCPVTKKDGVTPYIVDAKALDKLTGRTATTRKAMFQ